jgi:hypothetical protein
MSSRAHLTHTHVDCGNAGLSELLPPNRLHHSAPLVVYMACVMEEARLLQNKANFRAKMRLDNNAQSEAGTRNKLHTSTPSLGIDGGCSSQNCPCSELSRCAIGLQRTVRAGKCNLHDHLVLCKLINEQICARAWPAPGVVRAC